MKQWLIISLAGVVLLLLAVRGLHLRVTKANDERPRYVKSLGFHFSASVDSIRKFSPTNGLVFVHTSGGNFNRTTEDRVSRKLKFNGELRFIFPFKGTLAFHSRDLGNYQTGDSLAIDTDADKIEIFRQGKRVAESKISQALSGRLF